MTTRQKTIENQLCFLQLAETWESVSRSCKVMALLLFLYRKSRLQRLKLSVSSFGVP